MRAQARLFATEGEAAFSDCGAYRYSLTRHLGGRLSTCNFIMLNPSTADAEADDPTIRRCIGFCRSRGYYSRLVVTNLFAFRATDPRELRRRPRPVGDENDSVLLGHAKSADLVVCAWGAGGALADRGKAVEAILRRESITLSALRLTRGGHPCHPLYLPGTLMPKLWHRGGGAAGRPAASDERPGEGR